MAAIERSLEALAVRQPEAARMLGVSVDTFQRHVAPDLRAVRLSGRLRLYPVYELERWLDEHADHVLDAGSRNLQPCRNHAVEPRISPRDTRATVQGLPFRL